jgi:hypothetical protein
MPTLTLWCAPVVIYGGAIRQISHEDRIYRSGTLRYWREDRKPDFQLPRFGPSVIVPAFGDTGRDGLDLFLSAVLDAIQFRLFNSSTSNSIPSRTLA